MESMGDGMSMGEIRNVLIDDGGLCWVPEILHNYCYVLLVYHHNGIFFMLVSNCIIRAARRGAPSGIYGRTALATRAGVCPASQVPYVKDLTPSDTLVNCTYLVCTLLWDTFFTVTTIL
jgi:hypothetical protein